MREFSLQPLHWRGDDDVRVAHSKCLESNKEGEWIDDQRSEAPEGSWAALCSAALEDGRSQANSEEGLAKPSRVSSWP